MDQINKNKSMLSAATLEYFKKKAEKIKQLKDEKLKKEKNDE
jgi:hypothetical protein